MPSHPDRVRSAYRCRLCGASAIGDELCPSCRAAMSRASKSFSDRIDQQTCDEISRLYAAAKAAEPPTGEPIQIALRRPDGKVTFETIQVKSTPLTRDYDHDFAKENKAVDTKTGISIKFVKQYDVEADKTPKCGVTSHDYVCDREAGHVGSHRSYNEQIDEPVFWSSVKA